MLCFNEHKFGSFALRTGFKTRKISWQQNCRGVPRSMGKELFTYFVFLNLLDHIKGRKFK